MKRRVTINYNVEEWEIMYMSGIDFHQINSKGNRGICMPLKEKRKQNYEEK